MSKYPRTWNDGPSKKWRRNIASSYKRRGCSTREKLRTSTERKEIFELREFLAQMQEERRKEDRDRIAQMKELQEQARKRLEEEVRRHTMERMEDHSMMARLAEEVRLMREIRMGPANDDGMEKSRSMDQWVPNAPRLEPMGRVHERWGSGYAASGGAERKSQGGLGLPRSLFGQEHLNEEAENGKQGSKCAKTWV